MRLGAALWRFWQIRAHISEGRQLLSDLLAMDADVDPAVRAQAVSAAGSLAYWQNDPAATERLYTESLELRRGVGDPCRPGAARLTTWAMRSASWTRSRIRPAVARSRRRRSRSTARLGTRTARRG